MVACDCTLRAFQPAELSLAAPMPDSPLASAPNELE